MVWQACIGDEWLDVPAEDGAFLEGAYAEGKASLTFRARGEEYNVDLADLPCTLKNRSSGRCYAIRRAVDGGERNSAPICMPRTREAMECDDFLETPSDDFLETPSQCERLRRLFRLPDLWAITARKEPKTRGLVIQTPVGGGENADPSSNTTSPVDGMRILVWRNDDWHPVSRVQDRQIKARLRSGERIFQIRDGTLSWIIDTTPENGWVQISQVTGVTRAIKCQHSGSTPTGVQHPIECSTTAGNLSNLVRDKNLALLPQLTTEWHEMLLTIQKTRQQDAASCQATEGINIKDLAKVFRRMHELARTEGNLQSDWDLVSQTACDVFLKIDLDRNHVIDEIEWLHYQLLQHQAPSFHALAQVNERLLAGLKADSSFLKQLLDLFLASCEGGLDAELTAVQMKTAARNWMGRYVRKGSRTSGSLHGEVAGYLDEFLKNSSALEEVEMLTYYDFMNHMLGRQKATVQLYQYDLSNGMAKWISPLLLRQTLDGIWHSSIVVHNKEFWYGGGIFLSEPGKSVFGTPTKIVDLPERTMRTYDELYSYTKQVLAHDFTFENYDVVTNNCNHFSDAVCEFLLNCHLPSDVMKQPELLIEKWTSPLLRSVLNRALGRFESGSVRGSSGSFALSSASAVTPAGKEASDFLNKLVAWDSGHGWTRVARVLAVRGLSCDLQWLDMQGWSFRIEVDVPWQDMQLLRQPSVGQKRRVSVEGKGEFATRYHAGAGA